MPWTAREIEVRRGGPRGIPKVVVDVLRALFQLGQAPTLSKALSLPSEHFKAPVRSRPARIFSKEGISIERFTVFAKV